MFMLFLKEGILHFYCKFNKDACNFTYADYTILFFFYLTFYFLVLPLSFIHFVFQFLDGK